MIDFIFHILNFVLLIGIFVYLSKRYLVGALRRDIVSERLSRATLSHRLEELCRKEQHIIDASVHQKEHYQQLLDKMRQWQKQVNAEHNLEREQQKITVMMAEKRYQELVDYQKQAILCNQILPEAIRQAHHELEVRFSKGNEAQQYTATLFDYMSKVAR
jgi:hypothetical protein